jgi:hypothetical protein
VRVKQFGPIKANVYSAAIYLEKNKVHSKLAKIKSLLTTGKKLGDQPEFEETVSELFSN